MALTALAEGPVNPDVCGLRSIVAEQSNELAYRHREGRRDRLSARCITSHDRHCLMNITRDHARLQVCQPICQAEVTLQKGARRDEAIEERIDRSLCLLLHKPPVHPRAPAIGSPRRPPVLSIREKKA